MSPRLTHRTACQRSQTSAPQYSRRIAALSSSSTHFTVPFVRLVPCFADALRCIRVHKPWEGTTI